MMPAALNFGVIPDEIVELIYQAVPYLGIGKVRPFFKITNKILDYRDEEIQNPHPVSYTHLDVYKRQLLVVILAIILTPVLLQLRNLFSWILGWG